MSVLMSVIVGFVHGVAEILPISGSGHLAILQNLFNVGAETESFLFFRALLRLGTLLAVCFAFRKEIAGIVTDSGNFILKRGDEGRDENGRMKPGLRVLALILVGTIPLLVLFALSGVLDLLYTKMWFVSLCLLLNGCILFFSNRFRPGRKNECNSKFLDAFLVGIGQMLAFFPGLSRTGITITVALGRGCSRDYATRFSFLLAIPALLGAFLVSFFKAVKAGIDWKLVPGFLLGALISAIVGYIAIFIVRKLVKNGKFGKICFYCWGLGFITLILSFIL